MINNVVGWRDTMQDRNFEIFWQRHCTRKNQRQIKGSEIKIKIILLYMFLYQTQFENYVQEQNENVTLKFAHLSRICIKIKRQILL